MTDAFFSQTFAELQANHDKVSQTTGALIDENNLDQESIDLGFIKQSDIQNLGFSKYTENRFKGNQNWNVSGSTGDPLPGGTPTLYAVGSEIVAGVEVITTNAEQVTYVSGTLNSGNNTGILRRRYAKDAAGLINKSSQYGGIKLPDGSQLQALVDDIATNGVRITEDGVDVVIDVDLSVVTTGFRFFGMSDESGVWADINEQDSSSALAGEGIGVGQSWQDVSASRSIGVQYTNNTGKPIMVMITKGGNATSTLIINGVTVSSNLLDDTGNNFPVTFIVPDGHTYQMNNGAAADWAELR